MDKQSNHDERHKLLDPMAAPCSGWTGKHRWTGMRDDLLRVGTALYLTGQLVEQARARVTGLVERGYKLSSPEVLEASAAFHLVSNRFLALEAEFEQLKGGQAND